MSGILGLDTAKSAFSAYETAFSEQMEKTVAAEMQQLQKDVVNLVPHRTGRLARWLSHPDAIKREKSKYAHGWRYRFGLPKQGEREAYYWFWVEFGTKGHSKGENRAAGKDKRGNARVRRVKRDIPARRAQPALRPAFVMLKQRLATGRALAKVHALALAAARGG